MTEVRVSVDAIQVVGRHRRDLGDLDDLAKSIADVGLLNPITLTADNRLIAGERRLAACRSLGWSVIPARRVESLTDAVDRLKAERDENTCRKEMTVSERVALAQALEELEKPAAEQRRRDAASRAGRIARGTFKPDDPTSSSPELKVGQARDIAAAAVGMSPSTYQRARTVVRATTDPDPEVRAVARKAQSDMDATGNVVGNYEKVRGYRDVAVTTPTKPAPIAMRVDSQRRAINNTVSVLAGIADGIDRLGELRDGITSEEAAQWVDGLTRSRRALDRLIKQLKERANG